MDKLISVAIDGPSGAGKSTIARAAYAVYLTGKSCTDAAAVRSLLPTISISMDYDCNGVQRMFLNGEDVSDAIRTPENSIRTSQVSALSEVRAYLMEMQRDQAKRHSVVMDGRDIGTVVLPDASLKIFLTASAECRAERRCRELQEKGIQTSIEEVLQDIEKRDWNDTHRDAAPLRQAPDARLVDTSGLTLEESIDAVCKLIQEAKT